MSVVASAAKLLGRAALALMLVALVSWSLVECAPGSTAERAAVASRALVPGDLSLGPDATGAITQQATRDFQLHESALWRAGRAGVLDFGVSWQDRRPVRSILLGRAGATTLSLVLLALLVAFVVGLLGAAASARNKEGLGASAWALFAAVVLSLPLPWLAMVAINTLAYGRPLSLFPQGGASGGTGYLLPVLVMALAPAAVIWRHAHQEMQRLARDSWVVAARARGNSEARIWRVLILRASLPQVLPLVPVLLAYLLAASVIIERVFALEGAGEALASAAHVGNVPVLVGFAAISALCISVASSLVDAAIRRLDPRARSA